MSPPNLEAAMQADIYARHGFSPDQIAYLMSQGQGAPHLMGPGAADVHIDSALSNLAVEYKPNRGKLIADEVCPVIRVAKRSDRYFVYSPSTHIDLSRSDIVGQMGMPTQVSWGLSQDSYAVRDHGFRDFVPFDVEANADAPLRPLADSTEVLTERLLLAREKRVADLFGTAGNYGSNALDLSTTTPWSNSSSDPVTDIETALATPGLLVKPNTAIFGKNVWDAIRRHPALERYILSRSSTRNGAVPMRVDPDLFAQAFGLDKVLIAEAKYNSAAPGAALSTSYLWGNICALVAVEKAPAMNRTEAFAYTFRFAPAGGNSWEVRTWYDQAPGVRGGTWIKVTHSETEKIVAGSYSGYLFYNAV